MNIFDQIAMFYTLPTIIHITYYMLCAYKHDNNVHSLNQVREFSPIYKNEPISKYLYSVDTEMFICFIFKFKYR